MGVVANYPNLRCQAVHHRSGSLYELRTLIRTTLESGGEVPASSSGVRDVQIRTSAVLARYYS